MAIRPTLLLVCLLALPVRAQEPDPVDVEHTKIVSATSESTTVKRGDVLQLVFKLKIDPDWHIYSPNGTMAPTEWKFEGPVEPAGMVVEPTPKRVRKSLGKGDDGKERFLEYDSHEGEVTFRVPVKLTSAARAGPLQVKGKITGQECDPSICLGLDLDFAVDVTVDGEAKAGDTTPPPAEGHTRIVSVTAEPAKVKVGETFHLVFKVAIEADWYIYGVKDKDNPTRWTFGAGIPAEVAGTAEEPKMKRKKISLGKDDDGKEEFLEYDYHEGSPTFRVPVRLTAGAKPGSLRLAGAMTGQECSNVCMLLDVPFATDITVAEGVVAVTPPTTTQSEDGDQKEAQEELGRRGLVGFFALAVLGGLISLVMPCTYPMIPVTLTYFLKQGGESRSKGLLMSLAYSAGIVVSFTALGLILSIAFGADGPRRFAASPWANMVIGAIFLYFTFSLFGLYEIKLPSFLTNTASGAPRSGVGGAFVLGLLFSVVTFTCTIPIAATVLAVAASSGGNFRFIGLIAMLVYSVTMTIPFIILGLFPSLLREVPKSGGWLQTVKVTTAFAELGLALAYFAKADLVWDVGVLTRNVMIAVWVAVLAFMSLYLLGLFRLKDDTPPPHLGVARILCAMIFGISAIYLGFGAKTAGVFDTVLPAYIETTSDHSGGAKKHAVFLNLDLALEEARRVNKPVFVEFTGAT